MVSPRPMDDDALHEALSALADGRATPADWARIDAAWARDPALRERWALWHVAADGLRSAELAGAHRDPEALLAALHARLPAPLADRPRRRDWFAPIAVAAGFVAVAVGVGALRVPAAPPEALAALPASTPSPQALAGTSFAQAAAAPTAATLVATREPGLLIEAPADIIDWRLPSPASASSRAASGITPR